MELDELKKELNLKLAGGQPQRSAGDIGALLEAGTASVLQKIRKSILFEMLISVAFALLCVYVIVFSVSWQYHLLFSILSVIAAGFIGVLYFLLKKTNATIHSATIKENLQQLITIMEEYTKRYVQLVLFFLPVCFALGVWLSYNDPENVLRPLTRKTVLLLGGAMVVLGVMVYVFTKWYMRRLYGKYIGQLKASLREFDEE
jgi:glucan phosphoethanolaminetransferase (alkaline phosphatase superfamily)